MKTKSITQILTLLYCLSGTVYSEDKKDGLKNEITEIKKSERAYGELTTIQKEYANSLKQIEEIKRQLYELYEESPTGSQNRINFEFTSATLDNLNLVRDKIQNIRICLVYEDAIYQPSITNVKLLAVHSMNRRYYFNTLLGLVNYVEKLTKNFRISIQNTTAVIAINKNLDLLTKLKKWAELNKDTPNKFKQKKNEN